MKFANYRLGFTCASFLFVLINRCPATTFYVDQQNAASRDENDGSESKPLKTIGAAVAKLNAGDSVIIHAGVYREAVTIKASGVAQHLISISAAWGERVIIDGADIVKGWTPITADAKKRPLWVKADWEAWAKLSADPKTRGRGPQIAFDSIILHQAATMDAMFPGTFFADIEKKSIVIWPLPPRTTSLTAEDQSRFWDSPVDLASSDPNQHLVEVAVRPVSVLAEKSSFLTVKGLTVRHGANGAQEGAMGIFGDHDTVEECTVEYTHGRGFSVTGQFDAVRNCSFNFNGSCGGGAQLSDSEFSGNMLCHNSNLGVGEGWENGGIKFSRTVNTVVRANRFISNEGPGLWYDFCNNNLTIERNLAVDNAGANIMMEITPNYMSTSLDAHPELNTKRNEKLALPWHDDGINIIRNNICANARGNGASGILLQLASRTHVLNNTIVGNGGFGVFIRYHPYNTDGNRCWDNVIMNNLLVDNGPFQVYISPDPSDKPGFVARNKSDNNLLFDQRTWTGFDGDAARYTRWGKTELNSYSQEEVAKIFGWDQHSIQGDPMFVAPATLDYQIQPGSPAIGAGVESSEVSDDFLGRPRHGRPSLGAYEFYGDAVEQGSSGSKGK